MAVDNTLEPLLQRRTSEIDQQPDGLLRQSEIGEQLLGMHRSQSFDRFDFDQQPVFNEDVYPEGRREMKTGIIDVYRPLPFDPIPPLGEHSRQNHFVNALEEAGTKVSMQLQCRVDHIPADLLYISQILLRVSASPRD